MGAQTTARRPLAAASALLAMAAFAGAGEPTAAWARPLQVEDVLQREEFGAVRATPDGRWLMVEQRAPYTETGRFDYQLFNSLFRSRPMVANLGLPGPLRPLGLAEAGVGYQIGPASPDGARVVVYRLKADRWELGVATLATGQVLWLTGAAELDGPGRTVQWRTATILLAIVRATGDLPYEMRWMRPQAALPERWAKTASGGQSVTVLGSGRYLGVRPRAAPKAVVEISALTGSTRTLARGDFTDLELAPSGRHLAVLEAGPDIALAAGRPVQGDYGVAVRRMRLLLIDLRRGSVRRPCPGADILANLLAWSPEHDELLAYARDDGAPWSAGRLIRIDATRLSVRPIDRDIRPAIERRPEVVYGGWWGGDPIVFGRPAAGGRLDWYRLGAGGPVRLTGNLKAPPREGLVVAPNEILLAADGAAWRIGRDGSDRQLIGAFTALSRRTEGIPPRPAFAPRLGRAIIGMTHSPAGDVIGALGADGRIRDTIALPSPSKVLTYVPGRGAAVDRLSGGGREDLEWRGLDGRTTPLATINKRFAEIDTPRAVAVPHRGPNGEALRSWVLLPKATTSNAPPPLIVIPYLGSTYADSPAAGVNGASPIDVTGALVGHGYAVLVPSLPVKRGGTGPADGLAQQVLDIVDAAAKQPELAHAFDPRRLGLWGHSFGGYSTLAILTQTDRFRAAVAQAAVSDLISQAGVFSAGRRIDPDEGVATPWQAGWVENLQGDMGGPPWAETARYVRNSPVLHADRITTPLMIVHGDQDFMALGQAEEMFSALYRQDKDALLVTYWGEGHLYASPGNLRDLYARVFGWFDEHLSAAGR